MKSRGSISLWRHFTLIILCMISLAIAVSGGIMFLCIRNGIIDPGQPSLIVPLLYLILISTLAGGVIALTISRRMIRPMIRISEATREIARGNFSVRLSEDNRVAELRGLCHDFNRMAQELSGVETLRNDFVVSVSHEFKTPLAAIEGYATLLQGEPTGEERAEYTKLIIESTRRLSSLCGNILRLSRLENQEIVAKKSVFSLDEQIRKSLLLLEAEWSGKGQELELLLEPVIFYGSEELLAQVWLNLLGNAVKFTPCGGRISVRLYPCENEVVAEIEDTGPGITPEAQQHIFEKFYQADRTRGTEGNGLGLALVKRIVSLCGGSVSVKSAPDEGSCFTVRLLLESPHQE